MKSVAIINPIWGKHIPFTFSGILTTFNKKGIVVRSFSPDPEQVKFDATSNSDINPEIVTFHRMQQPQPPEGSGLEQRAIVQANWSSLGRTLRSLNRETGSPVDFVFITWVDHYVSRWLAKSQVDRSMDIPWTGLYLHPQYRFCGHSRRKRLLQALFDEFGVFRARNCRGLFLYDEGIIPRLDRRFHKRLRVLPFPDFSNLTVARLKPELVSTIKRLKGLKIVGLFGSLQRRKGFLELLQASMRRPAGWGFIVAGSVCLEELTESERIFIEELEANPPENVVFLNRHLDEASELNPLLKECHLLFLAYKNFVGSSQILTKAAAFRIPAIVNPGFLLEERVNAYELGWVNNCDTSEQIMTFLQGIDRSALDAMRQKARFEEYSLLHDFKHLEPRLNLIME